MLNKFTDENHLENINHNNNDEQNDDDDDDVDAALSKLEKTLDVQPPPPNNKSTNNDKQPQPSINQRNTAAAADLSHHNSKNNGSEHLLLCEDLFLMKQQKYTFKKFKTYFFVLSDTHYLSYYKSREESNGRPVDKINLKGCELVPDVNVAGRKFGIQLRVPTCDGMTEMTIRCPHEESYAQWMSACKLASRNKSIADPTFKCEVNSILNLLTLQQQTTLSNKKQQTVSNFMLPTNGTDSLLSHSKSTVGSTASSFDSSENAEVQASNLLPLRMLKKYKLKQVKDLFSFF